MNSYIFLKNLDICKFKEKGSKIILASLFSGNVSKDSSINNMKKTGWYRYYYDFSFNYDSIDVAK